MLGIGVSKKGRFARKSAVSEKVNVSKDQLPRALGNSSSPALLSIGVALGGPIAKKSTAPPNQNVSKFSLARPLGNNGSPSSVGIGAAMGGPIPKKSTAPPNQNVSKLSLLRSAGSGSPAFKDINVTRGSLPLQTKYPSGRSPAFDDIDETMTSNSGNTTRRPSDESMEQFHISGRCYCDIKCLNIFKFSGNVY